LLFLFVAVIIIIIIKFISLLVNFFLLYAILI